MITPLSRGFPKTNRVLGLALPLKTTVLPAGYAAWTLRLSAGACVELRYTDSLLPMTAGRLLKKHNEPLAGWRDAEAVPRRTKQDWTRLNI
jgi:hypothetical protein